MLVFETKILKEYHALIAFVSLSILLSTPGQLWINFITDPSLGPPLFGKPGVVAYPQMGDEEVRGIIMQSPLLSPRLLPSSQHSSTVAGSCSP